MPAHRDEGLATLRPERRDDRGGARSPIVAGENCLLDFESIHQRNNINGESRMLPPVGPLPPQKKRGPPGPPKGGEPPADRPRQPRGAHHHTGGITRAAPDKKKKRGDRG